MKMTKKCKDIIGIVCMVLLVLIVTAIPYVQHGTIGFGVDMLYHMTRIEAVKEALLAGQYPAYVNPLYFGGYGYASSAFYPDIFLVPAALLRILGLSPLLAWKANVLMIAFVGSIVTYWSLKYISENRNYAMAGTLLLMLSQFYLADIVLRTGLSEYTACVFVPVLMAGIYDFFAKKGEKTYLIGIAFVGLLLSHTIMTLIALVLTTLLFLCAFIILIKRKEKPDRIRICRLIVTAIGAVLLGAYYAFPMLEQMLSNELLYTEPWAHVAENTQSFISFFCPTGYFDYVAYVGVGVPILMLLGSRVIMGGAKNKWSNFFLGTGIFLLVAMTDIFPWKILQETFMNALQFTYRLYPYALCCIVIGLMLYFKDKEELNHKRVCVIIALLAVVFGVAQNVAAMNDEERKPIDEELVLACNNYVGKGEWFPVDASYDVFMGSATHAVLSEKGESEFVTEGYGKYSFVKEAGEEGVYTLPLLYYKGYEACFEFADGTVLPLEVMISTEEQVEVQLESDWQGIVRVHYAGTMLQKISKGVSLITLMILIACWVLDKKGLAKVKRKTNK